MDDFTFHPLGKDQRLPKCKCCLAAEARLWRKKNPKKMRLANKNNHTRHAMAIRSKRLKDKYGIDIDEYAYLLEKQGYVCAICERPETKYRNGTLISLAVDHCHATGKVRGLLCILCNRGIGNFHDNPNKLQLAIDYLNKHV